MPIMYKTDHMNTKNKDGTLLMHQKNVDKKPSVSKNQKLREFENVQFFNDMFEIHETVAFSWAVGQKSPASPIDHLLEEKMISHLSKFQNISWNHYFNSHLTVGHK